MGEDDGVLRVVSWNLWGSGPDPLGRLEAAAGVLDGLSLDAVAVQEDVCVDGSALSARLAGRLGWPAPVSALDFDGSGSSCAVLSPHPLRSRFRVALPGSARSRALVVAELDVSGRSVFVGSAHLAWGSLGELARARQAAALASFFDELFDDDGTPDRGSPLAVVGMDANAESQALCMRFLAGADPFETQVTWWTDAFAAVGSGVGFTSTPDNPHAAVTAAQVGIGRPDLLKERRIDFVWVRGYAHGRDGTPLRSFRVGDGTPVPSDHYGVFAELLLRSS